MESTLKQLFTCIVEPRWGKPTFTMRKKVNDEQEALTLAVKYKQLSGGFNNYSNFRYEGKLIDTKDLVHLKTGKLRKSKTTIGSCGCEVSSAKSKLNKTTFRCSKCHGLCCEKHYFFNVDGNNIAITRQNFKQGVCLKCSPYR